MTDTTKEAVESMADYYNRWAHDIREMNGSSVDADHADLTAATLRALVDENERLRADLANAVKVKPLKWEKDPQNVSFVDAEYVDDFGLYCIAERVLFIGHTQTGIPFDTVREAKAAAQADFERRILSAIATTPHPATEQPDAVQEAARLTPDQLVEQIADRLDSTDPDVAPWAVKWADDVASAISGAEPSPKAIAAALRALEGGER